MSEPNRPPTNPTTSASAGTPATRSAASAEPSVGHGPVELGLDTFGDIAQGPDGTPLHPAQVVREVLAEGQLADRLGLSRNTVQARLAALEAGPTLQGFDRRLHAASLGYPLTVFMLTQVDQPRLEHVVEQR